MKSVLKKKPTNSNDRHYEIMKDIEGELTMEKINTDLNTLMNSSPSRIEKRMRKLMRNM